MRLQLPLTVSRLRHLIFSRFGRLVIFLVFGLICFLIFFIWTFPYRALERRIEAEAASTLSSPIDLKNLSYAFPLGLRFDSLHISPALNRSRAPLIFRNGWVRPKVLSLLAGRLQADWSMHCFQGKAEGMMQFSPLVWPERYALDMDFRNVHIGKLPLSPFAPNLSSAQGTIEGTMTLSGPFGRLRPESGTGLLRIKQALAQIRHPNGMELSLENIRGETEWSLTNGLLSLDRAELTAKGLEATGSGSVRLAPQPSRAVVDISGSLRFTKAEPELYSLAGRMLPSSSPNFSIRGRAAQPRITFNK